VISSFAIHNIYDRDQRDQAIREIARVLKPGGRLAITDIRHVAEYEQVLRQLGWSDIQCGGPYFLFVIPTRMLRAIKPWQSRLGCLPLCPESHSRRGAHPRRNHP
jgi:arsenite methyltransferase